MNAVDTRPPSKNLRREKETFAQGRKVILRKAPGGQARGQINTSELQKLEATYRGIGDFFKKVGGGYHGYIFTGNLELIKRVGLRTKRRLIFYNGEIECRLLEYELYEGSQKRSHTAKQS